MEIWLRRKAIHLDLRSNSINKMTKILCCCVFYFIMASFTNILFPPRASLIQDDSAEMMRHRCVVYMWKRSSNHSMRQTLQVREGHPYTRVQQPQHGYMVRGAWVPHSHTRELSAPRLPQICSISMHGHSAVIKLSCRNALTLCRNAMPNISMTHTSFVCVSFC